MYQLTGQARTVALFVGILGWLGLVLDSIDVWTTDLDDPTAAALVWQLARYFTILTNLLAALTFAVIGISGRYPPKGWVGGIAFWLLVTAIVYHLLLASTSDHQGLGVWSDLLMHSVVPVAAFSWWLAFADKDGLGLHHALLWLIWPLVYCAYALLRGQMTGFYPYFFVNVETQGWDGVAVWVMILLAAFLAGGVMLVGLGRAMTRQGTR